MPNLLRFRRGIAKSRAILAAHSMPGAAVARSGTPLPCSSLTRLGYGPPYEDHGAPTGPYGFFAVLFTGFSSGMCFASLIAASSRESGP